MGRSLPDRRRHFSSCPAPAAPFAGRPGAVLTHHLQRRARSFPVVRRGVGAQGAPTSRLLLSLGSTSTLITPRSLMPAATDSSSNSSVVTR